MSEKVLIDDKAVAKSNTTVQFGAISAPTPLWAKWLFRSVFIVTSAIVLVVAGTQRIAEADKFEILLVLKGVDALALGFSKMFGVVEKD
jgi:hypothetical protein